MEMGHRVDVSLHGASLLRQEIAQQTFTIVLFSQADPTHVITQHQMEDRLWASCHISDIFTSVSRCTVDLHSANKIKDVIRRHGQQRKFKRNFRKGKADSELVWLRQIL